MADQKNYIEIRKQELLQEAQQMKDRLIDELLTKVNLFMVDWNNNVKKRAELEQSQIPDDKINK